ncbi:type II toxin-antitoxin system Phd/YefM family antitoxin [Georgenia sp. TF02-10]|uniref:type II toxin-antitoxin system Phd/YefM family antitoxin n=1 Tax=Georgenia sp. TF02-10 TaxID=2917725 RepID=UPI001FA78CC4|nr:type II toxin-antitoxin system Phd/YefM family antitoxin [Georgenia sp. TF02-10]UNX55340.1 type II toxin-antitoxin system Phd/YefM family antitoxin [Georgenia sp. TF02-10]
MDRVVPIDEARAHLGALLDEAREHEVHIRRDGRPAVVLLSMEAYERLLGRLEDAEDALAVLTAAGDTVPFERPTSAAPGS